MKGRLGRRGLGTVILGLVISLAIAGIALAVDFVQPTSLSADSFRANRHRVVVHGRLTSTAHHAFCTHNRPIKVTNTSSGRSKTVYTDSTGHYSVGERLRRHHHRTYRADFFGRASGVHPNHRVCKASHATTSI